jgi:hypothetical protein
MTEDHTVHYITLCKDSFDDKKKKMKSLAEIVEEAKADPNKQPLGGNWQLIRAGALLHQT